jgi:hypothetical protein
MSEKGKGCCPVFQVMAKAGAQAMVSERYVTDRKTGDLAAPDHRSGA